MKISKKTNLFLLSALGISAGVAAIVIPLNIPKNYSTINIDISDKSKIGNQNRIDQFISNSKNIDSSKLINQLKLKPEFKYIDRSFITIEEAIENNWFEFEFYSSFKFLLYKNNLNASLEFIKPSETNSTYPVVGIKIFAGEGETYSSKVFEYNESSLNGFKQSNAEIEIKNIIDNIKIRPKSFFQLKKEVGKIGDLGIYAKNIKSSDFNIISDDMIPAIAELMKNNYSLSINSIDVDKIIPSKLKISFIVEFNNGKTIFKSSSENVILDGFDIELGKDDPQSKVENFIKDNQTFLDSLKQFFVIDFNQGNDSQDKKTIDQYYKEKKISFNANNSNLSTAINAGLSIEFNNEYIEQNDSVNKKYKNVFSSINDSQTPIYRLLISSYKNTPLEYSKYIFIEGDQNTNFKINENQTKIDEFENKVINENNLSYDNFFTIDTSSLKFTLDGPFKNKTLKDVPLNILINSFNKYKEDQTKYKEPFNFNIKLRDDIDSKYDEYKDLLIKIVSSFNKLDLDLKVDKIEEINSEYIFYINIGLGNFENDLYISISEYLSVNSKEIENLFKSKEDYFQEQVDNVKNLIKTPEDPENVYFPISKENGEFLNQDQAINLMLKAQWNKIFSSIVILGMPEIEFPDFDSNVKVLINFEKLQKLNIEQINEIIKNKKIEFELVILKENISAKKTITMSFTKLFNT